MCQPRWPYDILDGLVAAGTAQGLFYSNDYQVRVPDVARHDALFADLLVHPAVLFLVRQYLGKGARAATWSSNTLLVCVLSHLSARGLSLSLLRARSLSPLARACAPPLSLLLSVAMPREVKRFNI